MRSTMLVMGLLGTLLAGVANAQDPSSAIAEARRIEAEDRARRLNAKVEDLEEAIRGFHTRFQAMADEIHSLRQEVSRLKEGAKDNATQDAIKRLADKIQEVDRNRESDSKLIASKFEQLSKRILDRASTPPPSAPTRSRSSENTSPDATEPGYEYVVRPGDTLSGLVTKLNNQGVKITLQQLKDANPSVKEKGLRVGQKLFIPSGK